MITTASIMGLLAAFQAIIQAAPTIVGLGVKAKEYFKHMFEKGLISKAIQDQVSGRVDAICEAALNGVEPPHWEVEPDPQ